MIELCTTQNQNLKDLNQIVKKLKSFWIIMTNSEKFSNILFKLSICIGHPFIYNKIYIDL